MRIGIKILCQGIFCRRPPNSFRNFRFCFFMRRLFKMDESVLSEHAALGSTEECYYLLEYLPGKRYGFSWENDAIKHLKRRKDRSQGIALRWKEQAIREVGDLLRPALCEVIDFATTTIVPVPPSRVRPDEFYDDRVMQLLRRACPTGTDIRELIVCREGRVAAHESERRPGVEELIGNYELGPLDGAGTADGSPVLERIVLFDDVITSGNHFMACKRFLLRHFPGREVAGVFVARRALSLAACGGDQLAR
jgi:predicted amidophosphoribosyltransferase